MTTTLNTMQDLIIMELQELYSAEEQVIQALPRLAEAASSPELKDAIQQHLEVTREQKQRLDQVFEMLGAQPQMTGAEAIKGLIAESERIIKAQGDPDVKDAAIIGAAQKVEHFEMAAYGTARSHAMEAGLDDIAELLQESLDEEGEEDELLTEEAETDINVKAAHKSQ